MSPLWGSFIMGAVNLQTFHPYGVKSVGVMALYTSLGPDAITVFLIIKQSEGRQAVPSTKAM